MSRPIKFRAWNKEAKQMIDLQKITPLALNDAMNTQLRMQGTGGLFLPFREDIILLQFTGRHDKNGKEIWEGDILSDKGTDGGGPFEDRAKVEWLHNGWRLSPTVHNTHGWFGGLHTLESEVIGNIYENGDLLHDQTPTTS